jgi:hypothetical protein
MVSDRGQWFVEARGVNWDEQKWFDADVWRACVESSEIPLEPRDLPAQANYMESHLEHLVAAIADARNILACLDRTRTSRAMRRLGLADV